MGYFQRIKLDEICILNNKILPNSALDSPYFKIQCPCYVHAMPGAWSNHIMLKLPQDTIIIPTRHQNNVSATSYSGHKDLISKFYIKFRHLVMISIQSPCNFRIHQKLVSEFTDQLTSDANWVNCITVVKQIIPKGYYYDLYWGDSLLTTLWQTVADVSRIDLSDNDVDGKSIHYLSQLLTENIYITDLVSCSALRYKWENIAVQI